MSKPNIITGIWRSAAKAADAYPSTTIQIDDDDTTERRLTLVELESEIMSCQSRMVRL